MDIIIIKHTKSACLAQPVEHAAVNRSVGGSSPSTGAIERNRIAVSFLFLSFSSNPLTLFSPCTTPACRSVGENMLFRRALRSLRGSSPPAGAIVAARRTSQHLAQQRGVFACMPALNPTENAFGGDPDLCPTENSFGGDPEAPLRVAKMQDVRCAPRSYGTIAPLSHFCSARRLRRGFFFLSFLPRPPLTLFSPCTTPACRSVGENMLFRRALRSLRGSSPPAGAIVAARRTSQHLAQQRGVFACMPALNPTENAFGGDPDLCPTENSFGGDPDAPLRVAKLQDVRCAPRSCGTIAPLSRFCSVGRLRRGFFSFFIVLLEPPDAVIPHRKYFRWGPRFMPSFLVMAENVFFNST